MYLCKLASKEDINIPSKYKYLVSAAKQKTSPIATIKAVDSSLHAISDDSQLPAVSCDFRA